MDHSITDTIAYTIRKATLAPLLAAVMLIFLYAVQPGVFDSAADLFRQLFFLSLFPLLAYPIHPMIPVFRDKGRDGQRYLAIIFALIGYLLNSILNLCIGASQELRLIGWVYFLSGVIMLILNRLCGFRASGHAAGVSAIVCLLVALGYQETLIVSLPLLILVCWASIVTKRHTLAQLGGGLLIPMALTALITALEC